MFLRHAYAVLASSFAAGTDMRRTQGRLISSLGWEWYVSISRPGERGDHASASTLAWKDGRSGTV
ncbi:hypothetical protein C8Q70DRAFT_16733 [Cubamyces menziesii]|nr:hypothetical protein C8Q70DRAFT_16733 [Cubamyces menziesii]